MELCVVTHVDSEEKIKDGLNSRVMTYHIRKLLNYTVKPLRNTELLHVL